MRFPHFKANEGDRAGGRTVYLPTVAMTPMLFGTGLRTHHILPLLARRRTRHGSGLGRCLSVVERTFAWLIQFRRLRVRYDKRADIYEAFLSLGCALIWQSLQKIWRTA